jgi:hypothetical protein
MQFIRLLSDKEQELKLADYRKIIQRDMLLEPIVMLQQVFSYILITRL